MTASAQDLDEMEAMAESGRKLGLEPETSYQLSVQTALGAARMAAEGELPLDELRRRVTSPGGTTAAALQSFEETGLRDIIETAMKAAANRSAEMAKEMD